MNDNSDLEGIVESDLVKHVPTLNSSRYQRLKHKAKSFYNKGKNALRTAAIVALTPIILAYGAAMIGKTSKAEAAEGDFGYVHTQFSLDNVGYDTAGGNDPDKNYFHTESGIEVRDRDGNWVETFLLPDNNIYGLAHDGTDLFASNTTGSDIFRYLGNDLWTGGLGISLSGARGLAASENNFFEIYNNGSDLAVMNKSGQVQNTFDLTSFLSSGQEGFGLYFAPSTNELGVTTDDDIYRLFMNSNFSAVDSWERVTLTGIGGDFVIGGGYNLSDGNLVLNDGGDTGKYASGPVVPEPVSSILFIAGGAALGFRRLMKPVNK